jgi:hypothetical protein
LCAVPNVPTFSTKSIEAALKAAEARASDLVGTGEAGQLLEGLTPAGVRHLISIGVLIPEARLSGRLFLSRAAVLGLAEVRAAERATAAAAFAEARQQP